MLWEEEQTVKSLQDRAKRLNGSSGSVRSELERYLNEVLGDEESYLDALSWWGINGHMYPIVSRMTQDILDIPLSTVASESTFSAGGRHVDNFRSSLSPLLLYVLKIGYAQGKHPIIVVTWKKVCVKFNKSKKVVHLRTKTISSMLWSLDSREIFLFQFHCPFVCL